MPFCQSSRDKLLKDIITERKRFEKNLSTLNNSDFLAEGAVGEWSLKDLLAHLTAWELRFLAFYETGLHGGIYPSRYPAWASGKAGHALNREIYEANRNRSLEDVLVEFHASYRKVLAVVQSISDEDLFNADRFAWTGERRLVDFVKGVTCNHYYWAKLQIRKYISQKEPAKRRKLAVWERLK